ncbi:MAG: InlB B-repeat-containing protein, partial [Oscillospiraceae bacterium]|nr:InlB B-repeat-containing protein [Oscillospiraceae bacterium]
TSTSTSTTDSSAGIVTRSVGPITPVTASEKLLTEGFESGTAFTESTSSTSTLSTTGWTAYNAGKGNNWNNYAGGSSYTHGGSYAARYYFSNSQDANCYLISAPFDVSSEATSLNLSLWAKSGGYNEAFEAFFVKTSEATTSGGVVSATHYTALASDTYTNSAYVQKKGSVADLAGESVRLVIHCTSPKNQFYLYIDDIAVTATLPDGDEPTMSDLDEALNVEGGNLHFTINEDDTYPWYVPEGQSYAQSGNAGISSSSSYLYLDLAMQAGDKLSFKYYVSSESSYDWFVFHDDGSESYSSGVLRLAGTYDWTTYEYTAETSGTYHFVWQFRKDSSTNYGEDCARLDDVEFLPTVPTYTITWNYTNSAGESASTTTSVKKNEMPVVPDIIPTSYEEDGVPYDLTGWTPTIAAATENTAYTAQYAVRQYDVTFNYKDANGNDQTSTQKVSHGQKATAPTDIPTTYTVNGKEYTFGGWDPDPTITPVTSDLTITASYYRDGYFTVIFKNWNGTVLKTQEVQRGQDATAPADPTRDGDFTFKGWDKDFTNVQSNLVVYAVFGHAITKTYTVTLRAVYGPKVKLEKTHIVWYANNDTGDYMESEDVPMNADIQIPVPAKDYPTTPAETYKYKKWDTTLGTVTEDLVWTNHEFLGWARVKESDNEGNLIWAEPEDHPKQLSLTYDDLFLKYDPATKTFTADQNCPAYDTQTGSSGAKTTPNWTSVNYVAADELTPYHAMYAVWANVFYVYHSGTGKVERIVIDNPRYEKKADGTNDLTKPISNTFDLTSLVSDGFLYGGYYKDYAGKSSSFDAKTATGWTEVTSVDAIKTKATVTPVATNVGLSDLVGKGRISQITDTGATLYNYDNLSKDLEKMVEDGEMTAEAAEAFEAKLTWDWDTSYNADNHDAKGNAVVPEAGKTYYIKEVPASMYLLHYTHYTYKFGVTDGVENKITKMWMISDIDDGNYQGAGFVYFDENHEAKVVTSLTIRTTGTTPKDPDVLTIELLFGEGKRDVTKGYLTYSAITEEELAGKTQIADIQNFWITPDKMMVTGVDSRTLTGISSKTTLNGGTLQNVGSTVTPYTPAGNTNP